MFFVHPDYQGMGIRARLLATIEERASAWDHKRDGRLK